MSDFPVARAIELDSIDPDSELVDQLVSKLSSYLPAFGISIDDERLRLCVLHLLYVEQVNHYINLTRITNLDEALVLHILDSLLFLSFIPEDSNHLLDMGSGPGYPGLPLHVCSGISTTLLDSVSKKMNAVSTIADTLGVSDLTCVSDRLETYAKNKAGQFDIVTARALASLPVLVEYARPLLKMGGTLIVSKGVPDESEISSGLKAAQLCGFKFADKQEVDLPDNLGHRVIFSFKVVSSSKLKLPRQNGLARKNPLA